MNRYYEHEDDERFATAWCVVTETMTFESVEAQYVNWVYLDVLRSEE